MDTSLWWSTARGTFLELKWPKILTKCLWPKILKKKWPKMGFPAGRPEHFLVYLWITLANHTSAIGKSHRPITPIIKQVWDDCIQVGTITLDNHTDHQLRECLLSFRFCCIALFCFQFSILGHILMYIIASAPCTLQTCASASSTCLITINTIRHIVPQVNCIQHKCFCAVSNWLVVQVALNKSFKVVYHR